MMNDKKKIKTLYSDWNNFIALAGKKPDITIEEIVSEAKAVRKARYARRQK